MFENWKEPKDMFQQYADVVSDLMMQPAAPSVDKPFLSIMIPTFRRANMLKQTIESAVNQREPGVPYEIVVVDNDSETDPATQSCVEHFVKANTNIYYYRNRKNIGMFGNWNRCLELARGEWVTMLHDDDQLQAQYVQTVCGILPTLKAGVVGVFPQFMEDVNGSFVETEKCKKANRIKTILTKLSLGRPLKTNLREYRRNIAPNATGCIFNKQSALKAGGFDESTNVDYTFYDKLGILYGSYIIPQMLTIRGISEENLSNDWETVVHYAKIMKEFTSQISHDVPYSHDWVANYSTIAYIINNKEKYTSALPKKELCEKVGVPIFWAKVPAAYVQCLQVLFWLQLILF